MTPPREPVAVHEDRLATEYLANERTFLAWIRTSISVISLGFVISRFSLWMHNMEKGKPSTDHGTFSTWFGDVMMVFGAVLALLAALRHQTVSHQIEHGKVFPDRVLVWMLSIVVMLLGLGMTAYMFWTKSSWM